MPLHNCEPARKTPAIRSLSIALRMSLAAALLLLVPMQVDAGARKRTKPAVAPDPGYVPALAAANRLLHAWQTGDLEAGMVLLSDRARHAQDPEKFEQFFSGADDRAFEIGRGAGRRGHYRFPVILITKRGSQVRRRFSELVLVDTGKNDWTVDRLP